eukprot:CAMPEP_0113677034 /NCGR_PEP_ID=MMETSP0038_2-20120614/9017_1 /TAXON_ID=2898 /ORGANISM="Cryptomonas paramecium" /LENGTH=99 /DNA_ID=CAMNT_0000594215 /DNA_START=162 /DNA_END=459 /DNA_ORIENTATION=+ /assembly_acc=CAM_ASM_000170
MGNEWDIGGALKVVQPQVQSFARFRNIKCSLDVHGLDAFAQFILFDDGNDEFDKFGKGLPPEDDEFGGMFTLRRELSNGEQYVVIDVGKEDGCNKLDFD